MIEDHDNFRNIFARYISNKWWLLILLVFIILFVSTIVTMSIAPRDFAIGKTINIAKNTTLRQVGDLLSQNSIIKYPIIFKAYVTLLGGSRSVMAGDYLFDEPQSALRVAYRVIEGIQGIEKIKVTIPEGLASSDIGRVLARNIADFDTETFDRLAKKEEGYLFPDTYIFYQNVVPGDVILEMKKTFDNKVAKYKSESIQTGKSFEDIIKMASIVEKEATSTVDRQIVAGILWKRIGSGMPLQVDPPFYYFLGKKSLDLTLDDLAVDSPYNLYKNRGLPPTPISNPGLDAIYATIHPTETKFWFYLSDKYGNMHYAETHTGHLANKSKYLQ